MSITKKRIVMAQSATKVAGGRVSDAAVAARTGKSWAEWFKLLDQAGAQELDHRAIAILLSERFHLPDWWCQMVTVGYEQARGKRQVHETTQGFQVSVSKTISAPVASLYEAWISQAPRQAWLPDAAFRVSSATPGKSLHLRWGDGATRVDVLFYARSGARTQVNVQHMRLPSASAAEEMRAFWREHLEALQRLVEGKSVSGRQR